MHPWLKAALEAVAEGREYNAIHGVSCYFCKPTWPCPDHLFNPF